MARPSLDLAVEITGADGTQHRWGPEKNAGSIPQGLSFNTKQSEGFADASLTLSRRIDREYVDLHLLDSVVIAGADGTIAYEGRVAALPRSMQQTHQVTVQAVGWMAHTRDRKMQEIYVDRDLSAWQGPSAARQAILVGGAWRIYDVATAADATNNTPAVVGTLQLEGVKSSVQPTYDAGAGLRAAQLYYDFTQSGTDARTVDANWQLEIFANDRDDLTPIQERSGQLNATATSAAGYWAPATPRRFLLWDFSYATAITGSLIDRKTFWRNMAVYGDHGIPLVAGTTATDPNGVTASDVINHLVAKYCPKLNTDGVHATSYPIPHLVFKDRTDPYDALLEVNKFHLWQLAVYENRTLSFRPVDLSDYDWEVRLSDAGTTVELQGDSTDTLANGITVTYQDVATGRPNVLTPDDFPDLKDPSDSNPATLAGLDIWTEISLSSPSTQDAALQVGRAALAEFNQPKSPGTISVQGHIRDRAGHWQPAWKVRNGDRIVISDHPNDRPRLVVETSYSHDNHTLQVSTDSTFKRLDAVLDRLGTALRAANLTS